MDQAKKDAVLNAKTFDELLDIEYGVEGTPKREQFNADAAAFSAEQTREKTISRQQYEQALERIEELLPLVNDYMPSSDVNAVELALASDIVEEYEKAHYPISRNQH